jgi:hypothetical protein
MDKSSTQVVNGADTYGLKNIILHDGYGKFRSRTVQFPVGESTYVGGGNAEGKTSVITLIPVFYGQDPVRLISRASGKLSFVEYYLPSDQSMIIYEYTNVHGMNCAVLTRGESGKLNYRFIEGSAHDHLFSSSGTQKLADGASAREMFAWLKSVQHPVSKLISIITDYRAIIQRSKQLLKRNEDRSRISLELERYGLGDHATDLTHLEKITSGLISKSLLMESLKQVICDSLLTHLHINTKPPMANLKHAIIETRALAEFKSNIPTFEKCILDNKERIRYEQTAAESVDALNATLKSIRGQISTLTEKKAALKSDIQEAEDDKSSKLDKFNNDLSELKSQIKNLNSILERLSLKQSEYEQAGMAELSNDFDNIGLLNSSLDSAKQHLSSLKGIRQGHIKDRDEQIAQINKMFERKRQEVTPKIDRILQNISDLKDSHHEQEKNLMMSVRREVEAQREEHAKLHNVTELRQMELKTSLANLRNTDEELALIDVITAQMEDLHEQEDALNKQLKIQVNAVATIKKTRNELNEQLNDYSGQLDKIKAEQRKIIDLLNPKENSLLAELKNADPSWHHTIGKIINPELLARRDLSPSFAGTETGVYGWTFDLAVIDLPMEAQQDEQLKIELSRLDGKAGNVETQQADIKRKLDVIAKQLLSKEQEVSITESEIHKVSTASSAAKKQKIFQESNNKNQLALRKTDMQKELSDISQKLANQKSESQASLKKLDHQHRQNELELKAIWQDETGQLEEQLAQLKDLLEQEKVRMAQRDKEIQQSFEKALSDEGIDPKVFQKAETQVSEAQEKIDRVSQSQSQIIQYKSWVENELPKRQKHQDELNRIEKEHNSADIEKQRAIVSCDEVIRSYKSSFFTTNDRITQLNGQAEDARNVIRNAAENGIDGAGIDELAQGDVSVLISNLKTIIHKIIGLRNEVAKAVDKVSQIVTTTHAASQLAKQFINRIQAIEENHDLTPQEKKLEIAKSLEDFTYQDIPQNERAVTELFRAQANSLASYQESLNQLVFAVKSTSKRLDKILNTEQRITALTNLSIKLETKLEQSDSWAPLKSFTQEWRLRQEQNDINVGDTDLLDLMSAAHTALEYIRIDENLDSMIDMVISMEENRRLVNIRNTADLAGSSSTGMSYLAIMVIFKTITRYFCKGDNVAIAWPLDELESIDSNNYSNLFDMLSSANIYLITATPEMNRAKMWAFKNKLTLKNGIVVNLTEAEVKGNKLSRALLQQAVEVTHD